jgi:uncharacterized membrane protein
MDRPLAGTRTRMLINLLIRLRASLWFVPGLMIAGSIMLAIVLVEIDVRYGKDWLSPFPIAFGVGADGARGMLTAIASSMLTVATLAFWLTLMAVTQASAQYTPRIFRNFLRDRANQFVLGYFVSAFAYCLIVLRTIRGGDEANSFVPSGAVLAGLLLGLGGIFVLIFFIHHIAVELQINEIVAGVVSETRSAIEKLFPDRENELAAVTDSDGAETERSQESVHIVTARSDGYLQSVNVDGLREFAEKKDTVVSVTARIGQFVSKGSELAVVRDVELESSGRFFSIESTRTIEQDVGFGIRQLVDIALKALSPGVNDTTTAITCIDRLGEIIGIIAERRIDGRVMDKWEVVRVEMNWPSFDQFVEEAFDQIRISGRENMAVLIRISNAVSLAARHAAMPDRRRTLERQLRLAGAIGEEFLRTDYEREKVGERIKLARQTLWANADETAEQQPGETRRANVLQ